MVAPTRRRQRRAAKATPSRPGAPSSSPCDSPHRWRMPAPSILLGHELVYPTWARTRLSHLGTRLVYPAWARGSSIPPGHESSIQLRHELVYPAWARARLSRLGPRLVYPAWARGSSVPLGHELVYPTWARARLSHLGTSSSIPLAHGIVYPSLARARLSHLGTSSRDSDYADPHRGNIGGMATAHDATARAARSLHCALPTLEWMEAPTQRRQRRAAQRRLAVSEPTQRRVTDRPAGGLQIRQRQH